jgi:Domain of unknown function (DUF4159)
MRRSSQAGVLLAGVAASFAIGGCDSGRMGDARKYVSSKVIDAPATDSTRTWARSSIGAGLLAQEAPPAVGRPSRGGVRGPRMAENETPGRYPFYWTRAVYSGDGGFGGGWRRREMWKTDYPKGDRQFLVVLKRLVRLNAYDWENAVDLADPRLRRFPLIYLVEPGYMNMTEAQVIGLRGYLDAGGFLIVDDFWGSREWANFEYNMERVFPGRSIVDIPLDHPIFSAFYDIDQVVQVPNINNAAGGYQTHEKDGHDPYVRGIFDDRGRLMVVINWNTDLGDAWEWAESPYYPLTFSTHAYEMGANMIVYAMSH